MTNAQMVMPGQAIAMMPTTMARIPRQPIGVARLLMALPSSRSVIGGPESSARRHEPAW